MGKATISDRQTTANLHATANLPVNSSVTLLVAAKSLATSKTTHLSLLVLCLDTLLAVKICYVSKT